MFSNEKLPIQEIKNAIQSSFVTFSNIIIKASPGSGKTTHVPLYLLDRTPKKIYILEPRRLSAKIAALRVASLLNETIGKTVGYIFRYEKVISDQTRIFFLTEGTFLKILAQNRTLDDVGLIILDEFHERHLSTDAALSFIVKLQAEERPDLKIMIMSATIETTDLQLFLETSSTTTTLELVSHRFPLTIQYLPNTTSVIQAPLPKKVFNAVCSILESEFVGDILVFLPGMSEIRKCEDILQSIGHEFEIRCLILHGDLDSDAQMLVMEESSHRKIILSTNIAESSVTIPGISFVIDSGLQRESSYNFYSGLPELSITKISQASAEQRSGRANRLGPGKVFRLYAQLDFDQRPYKLKPEILRSDLSELYLMSLNMFDIGLDQLPWFETPPAQALINSRNLLWSIHSVDDQFKLTELGQKILNYSLHPRLGRILVEVEGQSPQNQKEVLTFLAQYLGERDIFRFINYHSKRMNKNSTAPNIPLEKIILTGFPDRIAKSRGEHYFDVILNSGETLKISSTIADKFNPSHQLWIILDLNNKGEVNHCLGIEEDWLYDLIPFPINEEIRYHFDEKKESLIKAERLMIGNILLSESKVLPQSSTPETIKILSELANRYIQTLYHSQEYERLLTLNNILNKVEPILSEKIALTDFFQNKVDFKNEDKITLKNIFLFNLKNIIDPGGIYQLEIDFPLSIQLTDKRNIPIVYDRSQDPFIESYIQDFYGLKNSPQLAKGKIALTLKLLGPHKMAIQVTKDLTSFWKNTYPQMVKELMREYPRHHWPQNPESASPILLKRQLPLL